MSDNLRFDPSSGILSVPTEKGELLGTPINSTIYMHPYEFRGCDHIFIQSGETEVVILGAFVFRIASDRIMDKFDDLVEQLVEAEFDMIVADEVSDCDWQQYELASGRFFGAVSLNDLDAPWAIE